MAGEGLTPGKIATNMNRLNIPAPGGGDWTHGAVSNVIKNHKYHGQLFRGVNPQSRIPGPKENAPAIIIENSHEDVVSFEDWKRINDAMRGRSREQGPTRVHPSPNPASGKLKCGPCWSNGYDSNLEIHRQKGVVRLRCSKKKRTGGYDCGFKGARLDGVLPALMDRLRNHFLTENTLEYVIDRIASESRKYLERQENNRAGVRERRGMVRDNIRNLKETLNDDGLGPRSRRSLTEDLERLLTEEEELDRELALIADSSEEAWLFVNNRDRIIETAMDLNTYTDPEDLEAVRELISLFVERVEVMDREHGVIHYDLQVRGEGAENGQAGETICFGKKKAPPAPAGCGLEQGKGLG